MATIKFLSDLTPAEYNPRFIERPALEGLKFSLDEFGDISGIVFNQRTGRLVAGHQRVTGLKEKYGDLQISYSEDGSAAFITPTGNIFKIRIVDWDEDKEKAANIAANAESIQGKWDESAKLIIEDVAISLPNCFESLNLNSLTLPDITLPSETIEVERQTSEISQEQRSSLRFGDVTVYLSPKELELLNTVYKKFIEINRTNFGFVTYLLKENDELHS